MRLPTENECRELMGAALGGTEWIVSTYSVEVEPGCFYVYASSEHMQFALKIYKQDGSRFLAGMKRRYITPTATWDIAPFFVAELADVVKEMLKNWDWT